MKKKVINNFYLIWHGQNIKACHCLNDSMPRSRLVMESYLEENTHSSFKLGTQTHLFCLGHSLSYCSTQETVGVEPQSEPPLKAPTCSSSLPSVLCEPVALEVQEQNCLRAQMELEIHQSSANGKGWSWTIALLWKSLMINDRLSHPQDIGSWIYRGKSGWGTSVGLKLGSFW